VISVLAQLLFGWPAIAVTVILDIICLIKNNYRYLVAAAMLAFLFSWFLSGFRAIQSAVFLLPLFLFGFAYLMYRGREMFAWISAQ